MSGGFIKRSRKLVLGIGINDADYNVKKREMVDGKEKIVWVCPFYQKWISMLTRCYSERYQKLYPSYQGCTVCDDWITFSGFRGWMIEQEWEGLNLEKDLLVQGNKIYSPETCVFTTPQVNGFLTDCRKSRGEWPIGVHLAKGRHKFMALCQNPFTKKQEYLGVFASPYEAHKVWLAKKLEHAYALAAIQTNPLVAEALIDRYLNYQQE